MKNETTPFTVGQPVGQPLSRVVACPKCGNEDLKQVRPVEQGYRYFICHNGHLLRQPTYGVELEYLEPDVFRPRFLVGNLELAS